MPYSIRVPAVMLALLLATTAFLPDTLAADAQTVSAAHSVTL